MTPKSSSAVISETMSDVPDNLYYTAEHEWIRVEGDEMVIGITDHAQNALTDIVYVELPEIGSEFGENDEFATVESVKSVSSIFAPLSCCIISINEELDDAPELINQDPYGEGWIVKVTSDADPSKLLSASDYLELIGE